MRPHSRNIHRHRSRETVSALDERAPRSRPLADVAPRLRGLSVAGLSGGLVFTWSATADTFAALDACQYLTGGPCVQAAATGEPVHASPKTLLAGGRWELFATAAAAAGVGATLSLPVPARRSDGTSEVIGTVNLYGGPVDAFDGRREELVQWCTRWPPASALGTVSAAFDARRERFRRPEANRDQNAVDRAVAMLAERLGLDVTAAADRLSTAACHAGLAESQAAQLLNELLDPR